MNKEETLLRIRTDEELQLWHEQEKQAHELLMIASDLRFDKSIELVLFRKDIYDEKPSHVVHHHSFAKNYVDTPVDIRTSLEIAKAIDSFEDLAPCKIDIGRLSAEWTTKKDEFQNVHEFVKDRLHNFIHLPSEPLESKDVVLYGFGRIGRLLTRRIISLTGKGEQLRLKAIVIRSKMADRREEAEKRASLLLSDSVHGDFPGSVVVSEDGEYLTINGNRIRLIFANHPSEVEYAKYGIKNALLIDNTGVWRDEKALSQHLDAGIEQVILTAPGKDIPNIVHGVNNDHLDLTKDRVVSAASCTTNAIVPLIKILNEKYGINRGHIETIHAYTPDQNLLDNFHKKPRRGRGAALNMVLTTTGAANAVTKVFPHLKGKLTGNAVRVPTPNVSLAILSLNIEKSTDKESINAFLRNRSLYGDLFEQIHYSASTEYVSSNAVGMTSTSVVDAPSTIVSEDGKNITIYAWYDNEFGYACQVVRLAKYVAKVRRLYYY